jgi:hypothetical protein
MKTVSDGFTGGKTRLVVSIKALHVRKDYSFSPSQIRVTNNFIVN